MLLSLPKYDFNWQRDYDETDPGEGRDQADATWVYDGSEHNPASGPQTQRHLGRRAPDEMMYFRVNYRWADETVSTSQRLRREAVRLDDDANSPGR